MAFWALLLLSCRRMDIHSDGWTDGNSPLCSIGYRSLRVCCPKASQEVTATFRDLKVGSKNTLIGNSLRNTRKWPNWIISTLSRSKQQTALFQYFGLPDLLFNVIICIQYCGLQDLIFNVIMCLMIYFPRFIAL